MTLLHHEVTMKNTEWKNMCTKSCVMEKITATFFFGSAVGGVNTFASHFITYTDVEYSCF